MTQERNYALVGNPETGAIDVHEANCPVARQAAADGLPVMTLYGCLIAPDGSYDCPLHCLVSLQ